MLISGIQQNEPIIHLQYLHSFFLRLFSKRSLQSTEQHRMLCADSRSLSVCCCSVVVMSDALQPHGLPCPSLSPRVCSNSCPLSLRCYLMISYSIALLFSFLSFLVSGYFPMSQLFASDGQGIGAFSFSISPFNKYSGLISFKTDWFDLLTAQGTLKSLFKHHYAVINFLALCFLYDPAYIHT